MTKKIYLITSDLAWPKQMKILKKLMPYGIDYLQYRNKSLDLKDQVEEILQLKMLCDLSIDKARSLLDPEKLVGATAKTVDQAKLAEKLGASYLGVGAFYPSSTKRDAKRIDIQTLRDIRNAVKIPIIGIGGLTPDNIIPEIRDKVDGFAFSNAIWHAENPEEVFLKFKALV